jgi:hypothetical protein
MGIAQESGNDDVMIALATTPNYLDLCHWLWVVAISTKSNIK